MRKEINKSEKIEKWEIYRDHIKFSGFERVFTGLIIGSIPIAFHPSSLKSEVIGAVSAVAIYQGIKRFVEAKSITKMLRTDKGIPTPPKYVIVGGILRDY